MTRWRIAPQVSLPEWSVRCGDVQIKHYISGMSENVDHMWPMRSFWKLTVRYADPAKKIKDCGWGQRWDREKCHNLWKWTPLRGKLHSSLGPWFPCFILLISGISWASQEVSCCSVWPSPAFQKQKWIIVRECLRNRVKGQSDNAAL